MNSTMKEDLKKRLKQDSLSVDLTDIQSLNEDILTYIAKRLEKFSNSSSSSPSATDSSFHIGTIKWNTKCYANLNAKCRKLMDKIETYLVNNNDSFEMFPSDYMHCLLNTHCYGYLPRSNGTTRSNSNFMFLSRFSSSSNQMNDNMNDDDFKSDSKWKLLKEDWKLVETFVEKDYKSILYLNEKKSQLVLSFQTTVRLDLLPVSRQDIVSFIMYSYFHARRAVEMAEKKNYFVSFTGYSTGGSSLAELSAYLFKNTKAVTFESLGTGLANENVTSYFSSPNFVNTSTGKQRNSSNLLIQLIDSLAGDKLGSFYSNGLRALNMTGLEWFLKELENSQKSLRIKKVASWPHLEFFGKSQSTLINNESESSFDFEKAFYSVPFVSESIPKEVRKLAQHNLSSVPKSAIQLVMEHLFNSYLIIHQIKNINENNLNEVNLAVLNSGETKPIKSTNLQIRLNYKLDEINWYKTQIQLNKHDPLVMLSSFSSFDSLEDEFLGKQLNTLKSLYKIVINYENGYSIESSVEIVRLRDKLYRYLKIRPDLFTNLNGAINEKNTSYPLISRENELLNIENIFKTGQFCCIEGAAGVGKSSLARQFYLTRQSKSQMKWIDADCFEKILFNFKLILSQLNITIECKSKFDFFDKLKINLNEYAAVNKKKFLFIIDNLIDEQDIELLMFGFDKSHFQFIITTQKNISEIPKIELKLATKEDCRKAGLHERILNTNNNNNNAFSLVRLSRMATFKNEIPKTDVNVVCFNNLIKQECLKASDFLNCLAYLDGNYNISLDLVRNLFLDTDANEFASALNYLIKGNILISSDQRFSLHSLIQAELIGDALRKNSSHLDRIVLVLNSLLNYSQIESNDLPAIEILFKQAKKVLKEDWKTKSKNKNCAELFYKIGLFYDTILFEYSEALDNYKESLLIYKQLKPLDYSQIDNVLGRIGNDYMRLDLNEEAVVAYREILPRHKSPGILNTLASVHEKLKQNNEALEIYKEAIDLLLKEENSPSTSEEICNTFSKIGSIYLNQKEYQEALVNFKQVLKIRKETLNSNHPSIAKCLSEIANINYHLGKYEDALKAFKEALRINKESLPGNHADLAHIMNVIGNIHFNMGQLEDALKNYKEAIRIKKETGSQAAVAMILNNIGLVYSRMEKYDDALTSLKESLSIKQREFAENHLSIANTLNNMGNAYFKLKQTDEALKCYTQAFTIFSERSPCSYASKADTLANLGVVYKSMGKYEEALASYQEVLKIRRERTLLSNQHPSIAKTLNNIGNVYFQMGKTEDALLNYNESLKIYRETLPSNHYSIANTLFNIEIIKKIKS